MRRIKHSPSEDAQSISKTFREQHSVVASSPLPLRGEGESGSASFGRPKSERSGDREGGGEGRENRVNTPILQTQRLTIGYRAPIASDLNLSLHAGQLVCLLGPNGGGKSTLLRTLAGLRKPLDGTVTLDGDDLHCRSPREVAQRISIVLTDRPSLGQLNGYALVAMGRHPHTDWLGRLTAYDLAVVRWAVEAVDAVALAERPVMELSDGQRQKLMIARALAQETDLILLDEPTAFLDLPRRIEVMRLLRELAESTRRAILLSTHDLDLALRFADDFWLLSGGSVVTAALDDPTLGDALADTFASDDVRDLVQGVQP